MFRFLKKLFAVSVSVNPAPVAAGRHGLAELSRRLGMPEQEIRAVEISYRAFQISKRTGGVRSIAAPNKGLKVVQRTILRRLLRKLKSHPSATGFEAGHSIVTNALPHRRQDVVIKLDIRDFFTSTSAGRVEAYFRKIGWDADAAGLLTKLCTHEGGLPQGAPTSPRLSNLLNYKLDVRLAAFAASRGMEYSRYADDMTFSGPAESERTEGIGRNNDVISLVKMILEFEGYALHTKKKLRIARRGDRQVVTGLVVNDGVNLPRARRRWLRAVEHHVRTGKPATLTPAQLRGWQSLQSMVTTQAATPE